MQTVVESIVKSSNMALWILETSADKELIVMARKVVELNGKAMDKLLEVRKHGNT